MFKVEVIADASGEWCSNALEFASEQDARDYAQDLARRWTTVRGWRVVPVDDGHADFVRADKRFARDHDEANRKRLSAGQKRA